MEQRWAFRGCDLRAERINGRWSRCPEESTLPLASDIIASLDSGVLNNSDADIARFKGKVTLNALSDLYGTKDSLRCSVIKTYQNDNMAAANWTLARDAQVTLCLN